MNFLHVETSLKVIAGNQVRVTGIASYKVNGREERIDLVKEYSASDLFRAWQEWEKEWSGVLKHHFYGLVM